MHQTQRVVEKRGANHVLHIILTVLTCGVWAITGWPIAAAMGRKKVTHMPMQQLPPAPPYGYPPQQQYPPQAYGQPGQFGPPPGAPPYGQQPPPQYPPNQYPPRP